MIKREEVEALAELANDPTISSMRLMLVNPETVRELARTWLSVQDAPVANAKLDVFRAACEDEPDAHGLRMTIGNQTFQIDGGPGFDSRDDAEWMAGQLRHALGRLVRVGGGA